MTRLDLGRVGVTLDVRDGGGHLDDAVMLEKLGYSMLWIVGGQLSTLQPLRDVVRATETVRVGSAIIPARVHPAEDVAALRHELEAAHPGRLITGLGGVQGERPVRTMNEYLDRLDAADPPVPAGARMLAALGPRMLELARDRAAGALALLVNPEYTADARRVLGDEAALAVMEYVVLESDPERARAAVREPVGFLAQVGGYPQNLRRMGLTDEDIAGPSDRLIDETVAWGDAEKVAARLRRHLDAGADQVVLVVRSTEPDAVPHEEWHALADALISG